MAELTSIRLNPESHLLLDQPLLRMPYNLARQTFKSAQRTLEHETPRLVKDLTAAQKVAATYTPPSLPHPLASSSEHTKPSSPNYAKHPVSELATPSFSDPTEPSSLKHIYPSLPEEATTEAPSTTTTETPPNPSLQHLDAMLLKMKNLKRKLETLHEEEQKQTHASRARLTHLQSLYTIPTLVDVNYEKWSRVRLSRLMVDYLLREGYIKTATQLAESKGIEELVDIDAFVAAHRIEYSLRNDRETKVALAWCKENAAGLKKLAAEGSDKEGGVLGEGMGRGLEFELRLQQYVEMVREGHRLYQGEDEEYDEVVASMASGSAEAREKVADRHMKGVAMLQQARDHAKKFFKENVEVVGMAAGLLVFKPGQGVEPYESLYAPQRWTHLAHLFLRTHHTLFSLPQNPLLTTALSAGLSALKTPACHSAYTSSSANALSSTTSVCPICSTELNALAARVPYAHHTKSIVENDPVVLPNGRIYGRERLMEWNERVAGMEGGSGRKDESGQAWIRDPMGDAEKDEDREEDKKRKIEAWKDGLAAGRIKKEHEGWPADQIKKVFIM